MRDLWLLCWFALGALAGAVYNDAVLVALIVGLSMAVLLL